MEQPNLGKRISELRKINGLTQQELAEQCKVNIRTLQRIENGVVTPRAYTVKAIFAALGCDFLEKDNPFMSIHFERVCNYLKDLFNLKINTMKKGSWVESVEWRIQHSEILIVKYANPHI